MTFMARIKENLGRFFGSPQELMKAARKEQVPHEKVQVPKRQTRFSYKDGPAYFLGQQVVKLMEDAGYPAKILYCYRSPSKQEELYAKGRTKPGGIVTKARAYQSAHQFMEACDIIHPSKGWDVSEDYWETLAACIRTVAEKYGVEINHGHYWKFRDSAHFELSDWKKQKELLEPILSASKLLDPTPTEAQLWVRFCDVLPDVARSYLAQDREPPAVEGCPYAITFRGESIDCKVCSVCQGKYRHG